MEWFKGKGDLLALIAVLLIIFSWIKADLSNLKEKVSNMKDNMATKADIARVESDIKEIRTLLIDHIKDRHDHKKQDRQPASEQKKSKSK